jgi:hypothetical protein
MKHTLMKDGRVNDMVMLDAAWDRHGLRSLMVLNTSTRSLTVESTSRKASARAISSDRETR